MKNYLGQSFWLALLLLGILIALGFLPDGMKLGNLSLRKMDIFEDIRSVPSQAPLKEEEAYVPDTTAYFVVDTMAVTAPADSVSGVPEPIPAKDSTWYGKAFEDYTFDQSGLNRFYAAVDSIRTHGRTVRVAFFGDSFVEGDILLGDLRDSLQSAWGGDGVGFVPITSEVARFKRTLVHEFSGWYSYSIVKKSENRPLFGINGFTYVPAAGAKVYYRGADYFKHTRYWSQVRLFYMANQSAPLVWKNEGSDAHTELLPANPDHVSLWKWGMGSPSIRGFSCTFPEPDGLKVYGASLESGPGFYLDNFSVRGNSGGPLKLLRPDMVRQFDKYQKYDLIVLQVGLNAVTNSLNNIKWYRAELDRTYDHLRACFPGKPILIVSVGDRAGKMGTGLATMRGVPAIVAMQRDLARQHGFLFYDLFWGMGGPGSIIELANHKPMLANKDYTHLTHEGGKVIAGVFAKLFINRSMK